MNDRYDFGSMIRGLATARTASLLDLFFFAMLIRGCLWLMGVA